MADGQADGSGGPFQPPPKIQEQKEIDILDDKIDAGMIYIYEKMCMNTEFNKIIEDMSQLALNTYLPDNKLQEQQLLDFKQLITLTLFSKHVFYITHKCICQHLDLGVIDDELLVELKKHTIDILKTQSQWPDI